VNLGIGCHVFSLEDTRAAYCDRVLSGESRVPAERIRSVDLHAGDLPKLAAGMERAGSAKGWLVDDRSGITASEIIRSVRRHIGENKTRLVMVDYIQLVRGERGQDPLERIGAAMDELANAAKQDGICYLVLAQLNRECEKREQKRPILSDLKSSGSLEERAKCVLLLYRPSVYAEKQKDGVPFSETYAEIIVGKNNQGRTGVAKASFDGETIRIY
jgi:replicative DNA helicase